MIIDFEGGRGELPTKSLVLLADLLDVSVDVLLGRGPMPPSDTDAVDVLRFYGAAWGANLETAVDESSRAVLEVFVNMHSDDPHPIWLEMLEGDPQGEKPCQGRMMGLDVAEARRLRRLLAQAIDRAKHGRLTTNTDCRGCGFSGDCLVDFGSETSPRCPHCKSTKCAVRSDPPSRFVRRQQDGEPRAVICWR